GALAFGLGSGAVAEVGRRTIGINDANFQAQNPFLTSANAERVVETLCRVRGAALKLGQMLSIQDETLIPKYWLDIFDRVRHSADFMPIKQVKQQLSAELGPEWRQLFAEFDEKPFAAASIGQVHKATSLDGKKLAVKVQYPGVADGIDADIQNLVSILRFGGFFPKGMYLEEFVKVARRELKLECDYIREAEAIGRMREYLAKDDSFFIPGVFPNLSSKKVLTTEFIDGKPVDECVNEPQEVRDYIAAKFMELCLREVFLFRFMQTDPNWSNFYFGIHPQTGENRLILLDFGAAREYPKEFVDKYMKILQGAYNEDREAMLKYSREIGFLTGFEDKLMEKAHVDSISILAETLVADEPYDFGRQDVTARVQKLVPIMLEHRLKAPPEEIYSLHRKLSGAYLLATKLKAKVSCGPLFKEICDQY
ncbi:UNVERIFIED_CONTAM: Atypical kinase coq-8, mitochondrial, partial [Eudyptes robustus]